VGHEHGLEIDISLDARVFNDDLGHVILSE